MKIKLLFLFRFSVFFVSLYAYSNPFEIDFPIKEELTTNDYLEVQKKLSEIDIHEILGEIYPFGQEECYTTYDDFMIRTGRGLRQVMILPEKGFYPKKELFKINNGGDSCVVCCVPFELHEGHRNPNIRYDLSKTIRNALEKTGFNGYFLLRTGGYPNPSGEEIRYAGVPYAFKIFMMLEAKNLGFEKVLWIDSACIPLRDPSPLFEILEKNGGLFHSYPMDLAQSSKYIFLETRNQILELTGVDCLKAKYICSIVLGLNMGSPLVQNFVEDYYDMVRIGTPFLSCFPEEFVFTALLGRPKYQTLHKNKNWDRLYTRATPDEEDSKAVMKRERKNGFYFFQRKH